MDFTRKRSWCNFCLDPRIELSSVERARDSWLRSHYGIRLHDYKSMASEQKYLCKICGKKSKRLVVDHDHRNGKVRGLLCHSCNCGLGHLRDSQSVLQNAIMYLNESATQDTHTQDAPEEILSTDNYLTSKHTAELRAEIRELEERNAALELKLQSAKTDFSVMDKSVLIAILKWTESIIKKGVISEHEQKKGREFIQSKLELIQPPMTS